MVTAVCTCGWLWDVSTVPEIPVVTSSQTVCGCGWVSEIPLVSNITEKDDGGDEKYSKMSESRLWNRKKSADTKKLSKYPPFLRKSAGDNATSLTSLPTFPLMPFHVPSFEDIPWMTSKVEQCRFYSKAFHRRKRQKVQALGIQIILNILKGGCLK